MPAIHLRTGRLSLDVCERMHEEGKESEAMAVTGRNRRNSKIIKKLLEFENVSLETCFLFHKVWPIMREFILSINSN